MADSSSIDAIDRLSIHERCSHIVSAAEQAREILNNLSMDELFKDQRHCLALERLIEIMGVASAHIDADVKRNSPEVDWQAIADLDARLAIASNRIQPDILWEFVKHRLPLLERFAKRHLRV